MSKSHPPKNQPVQLNPSVSVGPAAKSDQRETSPPANWHSSPAAPLRNTSSKMARSISRLQAKLQSGPLDCYFPCEEVVRPRSVTYCTETDHGYVLSASPKGGFHFSVPIRLHKKLKVPSNKKIVVLSEPIGRRFSMVGWSLRMLLLLTLGGGTFAASFFFAIPTTLAFGLLAFFANLAVWFSPYTGIKSLFMPKKISTVVGDGVTVPPALNFMLAVSLQIGIAWRIRKDPVTLGMFILHLLQMWGATDYLIGCITAAFGQLIKMPDSGTPVSRADLFAQARKVETEQIAGSAWNAALVISLIAAFAAFIAFAIGIGDKQIALISLSNATHTAAQKVSDVKTLRREFPELFKLIVNDIAIACGSSRVFADPLRDALERSQRLWRRVEPLNDPNAVLLGHITAAEGRAILREYVSIVELLGAANALPQHFALIHQCGPLIKQMSNQLGLSISEVDHPNRIMYYIYGAAGLGKSELNKTLMKSVLTSLGKPPSIWVMPVGDEFDSGYTTQQGIIVPDVFQITGQKEEDTKKIRRIIDLADGRRVDSIQSSDPMKGRFPIIAALLGFDGNADAASFQQIVCGHARSISAVTRRIPIVVHVVGREKLEEGQTHAKLQLELHTWSGSVVKITEDQLVSLIAIHVLDAEARYRETLDQPLITPSKSLVADPENSSLLFRATPINPITTETALSLWQTHFGSEAVIDGFNDPGTGDALFRYFAPVPPPRSKRAPKQAVVPTEPLQSSPLLLEQIMRRSGADALDSDEEDSDDQSVPESKPIVRVPNLFRRFADTIQDLVTKTQTQSLDLVDKLDKTTVQLKSDVEKKAAQAKDSIIAAADELKYAAGATKLDALEKLKGLRQEAADNIRKVEAKAKSLAEAAAFADKAEKLGSTARAAASQVRVSVTNFGERALPAFGHSSSRTLSKSFAFGERILYLIAGVVPGFTPFARVNKTYAELLSGNPASDPTALGALIKIETPEFFECYPGSDPSSLWQNYFLTYGHAPTGRIAGNDLVEINKIDLAQITLKDRIFANKYPILAAAIVSLTIGSGMAFLIWLMNNQTSFLDESESIAYGESVAPKTKKAKTRPRAPLVSTKKDDQIAKFTTTSVKVPPTKMYLNQMHKVMANAVYLHATQGLVTKCLAATGEYDRVIRSPAHIFNGWDFDKPFSLTITALDGKRRTYDSEMLEICLPQVIPQSGTDSLGRKKVPATLDTCTIEVLDTRYPECADLRGLKVREGDLAHWGAARAYCSVVSYNDHTHTFTQCLTEVTPRPDEDDIIHVPGLNGSLVEMPTLLSFHGALNEGECGSTVFSLIEGAPVCWAGQVVARAKKRDRTSFETLVQDSDDESIALHYAPYSNPIVEPELSSDFHHLNGTVTQLRSGMICFGRVRDTASSYSRTQIVPTEFNKWACPTRTHKTAALCYLAGCEGYLTGPPKAPPLLFPAVDAQGVLHDPFCDQFNRVVHPEPTLPLDPQIVTRLGKEFATYFIRPPVYGLETTLTLHEVLNGVLQGDKKLTKPLVLKTSAGPGTKSKLPGSYGLVLCPVHGEATCHQNGCVHPLDPTPAFQKAFDDLLEALDKGPVDLECNIVTKANEAISFGKPGRNLNVFPKVVTAVGEAILGPLFSAPTSLANPIAVGIDLPGLEGHQLAEASLARGGHIICVDIKFADTRAKGHLKRIADIATLFAFDAYTSGSSDPAVLRSRRRIKHFLESLSRVRCVVGSYAYELIEMIWTGIFGTSKFGSIYFLANKILCWAILRIEKGLPADRAAYEAEFLTKGYGDDGYAACDGASVLTNRSLALVSKAVSGVEYVNPRNKMQAAQDMPHYFTLEESVFLSRTPRREAGFFRWGLPASTIELIDQYTTKNTPDRILDLLQATALEYHRCYNKPLFDATVLRIAAYAAKHSLNPTLPHWEDLERCFTADTPVIFERTQEVAPVRDTLEWEQISRSVPHPLGDGHVTCLLRKKPGDPNIVQRTTYVAHPEPRMPSATPTDEVPPPDAQWVDITDPREMAVIYSIFMLHLQSPAPSAPEPPPLDPDEQIAQTTVQAPWTPLWPGDTGPYDTTIDAASGLPRNEVRGDLYREWIYEQKRQQREARSTAQAYPLQNCDEEHDSTYELAEQISASSTITPAKPAGDADKASKKEKKKGSAASAPLKKESAVKDYVVDKWVPPASPDSFGAGLINGVSEFFHDLFGGASSVVRSVAPHIESIAKFVGPMLLSRPPNERARTMIQWAQTLCHMHGVDFATTLAESQGRMPRPILVGNFDIKDMIKTRWSPVGRYTVTSAFTSGNKVTDIPLFLPLLCWNTRTPGTPNTYVKHHNWLTYWAMMYMWWAGDFEMMIRVVQGSQNQLRVAVALYPWYFSSAATVPAIDAIPLKDETCKGTTPLIFSVPCQSRPELRYTGDWALYTPTITDDAYGGTVAIYALNPPGLTDTNITATSYIEVLIRAAPNFEFYGYQGQANQRYTGTYSTPDGPVLEVPIAQLRASVLQSTRKAERAVPTPPPTPEKIDRDLFELDEQISGAAETPVAAEIVPVPQFTSPTSELIAPAAAPIWAGEESLWDYYAQGFYEIRDAATQIAIKKIIHLADYTWTDAQAADTLVATINHPYDVVNASSTLQDHLYGYNRYRIEYELTWKCTVPPEFSGELIMDYVPGVVAADTSRSADAYMATMNKHISLTPDQTTPQVLPITWLVPVAGFAVGEISATPSRMGTSRIYVKFPQVPNKSFGATSFVVSVFARVTRIAVMHMDGTSSLPIPTRVLKARFEALRTAAAQADRLKAALEKKVDARAILLEQIALSAIEGEPTPAKPFVDSLVPSVPVNTSALVGETNISALMRRDAYIIAVSGSTSWIPAITLCPEWQYLVAPFVYWAGDLRVQAMATGTTGVQNFWKSQNGSFISNLASSVGGWSRQTSQEPGIMEARLPYECVYPFLEVKPNLYVNTTEIGYSAGTYAADISMSMGDNFGVAVPCAPPVQTYTNATISVAELIAVMTDAELERAAFLKLRSHTAYVNHLSKLFWSERCSPLRERMVRALEASERSSK